MNDRGDKAVHPCFYSTWGCFMCLYMSKCFSIKKIWLLLFEMAEIHEKKKKLFLNTLVSSFVLVIGISFSELLPCLF